MRTLYLICLATITILPLLSFSTEKKYPVSEIPAELLKNANVVVREYHIEKTISAINNVVTTEKYVVTIFNKSAQRYGYFQESYNPLSTLSKYSLKVYNESGDLEQSSKKKDFNYMAAYPNFILFDDQKVLYNNALSNEYPYTVEILFTRTDKSSLHLGTWKPVLNYNVSVQNSSYKIVAEKTIEPRYKEFNTNDTSIIKKEITQGNYYWEIKNYKAIQEQTYLPKTTSIFPQVWFAPNTFEYDGYIGDLSSWEKYGIWNWNLLKDRNIISPEIQAEIKQQVIGCNSDFEKTKRLYEYLQENTRYVCVSLGIGGLQPFTSKMVYENKYGDCKALSNYMRSMLEVVGVESYYALISSGSESLIIEDFPMQVMNHVILCVPNHGDTIWLECTSQKLPFGYITKSNHNRPALLVKPTGGELVKTTTYKKEVNTETNTTNNQLNEIGDIQLNLNSKSTGIQYEYLHRLSYLSIDEQKEKLYKYINYAGIKIDSFNISQVKNRIPEGTLNIDFKIKKYAKVAGSRLIFNPNVVNRWTYYPKTTKNRTFPINIKNAFIINDTNLWTLPSGYNIEYLPDTTELTTEFGIYNSSYAYDITKNELKYTRYFEKNCGRFDASKYKELQSFLKEISQADKQKVVLIKND